jgi:ubiquinol-cytochrome c reductase cytochrome b subunit
MKLLLNWLDDRTGYKTLLHEALYERVPGGARWKYVWGSTLIFTFSVQMITGLFLWMAYSPSSQTAWESVYYIQHEMQFGWLLRGIHHFTAQAMIVLLVFHLMQVIIDGAYRAPREVNFWLGLILMHIVLGLSLTGYLLPWDQKGFWATKVATSIAGITPVVGESIQQLATGGLEYGHHTLTRFFALHAGLLPALLVAFLGLHLYVFRRHGITVKDPIHAPDTTFWPDQVLKDAVACLAVLATVLVLCVVWHGAGPQGGAELGAPADPSDNYSAARPEWYFLFLFELLKHFPGKLEIIGAMVIPGAVVGVLFLMPIVGRWKLGHRFNLGFCGVLMLAIILLTARAVWQDRHDPDYQWAVGDANVKAARVKELAQIYGIRSAGAGHLLHEDPKIAGAEIFKRNCASCHRYAGHDGTSRVPVEAPTASDLAGFGTPDWIRGMLTGPAGENFFGPTSKNKEVGERFTKGAMADWVKENVTSGKVSPEELTDVVEFLVSLSEHKQNGPANADRVASGMKFFVDGNDSLDTKCFDCHAMRVTDDPDQLFGGESPGLAPGAPDLSGYGSKEWLRRFLEDPGHKTLYGKNNAMPAFAERLSGRQMSLLIDFLLNDWPTLAPGNESPAPAPPLGQ